jgi:hypothetical protein
VLVVCQVLSGPGRFGGGCGSSTVGAPELSDHRSWPDDHRNQRTSRRPRFGHRAPFEHRSVHKGHSNDLVCRKCAGQRLAVSAPPGTRTPKPRIKGPNLVMSSRFDFCQPVPVLQVSDESRCRRMPAQADYLRGHRALMEHHDWHLVLDRQTGWGERGNGRSSGLCPLPLRRDSGLQHASTARASPMRLDWPRWRHPRCDRPAVGVTFGGPVSRRGRDRCGGSRRRRTEAAGQLVGRRHK